MASTPTEPVTVIVSRDVKPGRESDYHAWMHRVIDSAGRFPGNLGATVLGPDPTVPGLRVLVHRWNDVPAMRAWEASEERRQLTREADAFSTPHYQWATGLETWFTLPNTRAMVPPPRWKMFLVTWAAVFVLTSTLIPAVTPLLEGWPFLARQLVTNALVSGLLTWVVMPRLTRLLKSWLYPGDTRHSV